MTINITSESSVNLSPIRSNQAMSSRFSFNALDIMDALNGLTKASVHVNNPDKYGAMDELTKKERVVNFIDPASVSSYIQYMRESEGRTFVDFIDTTFEFSVYIERTTSKFVMTNPFTVQNTERAPQAFAQHIILDILKVPEYPHTDTRTIDMDYRRSFNNHPFKRALSVGLKRQGIIYMAEFNASIIIDRIMTLLSDNWKPEFE